MCQHYDNVIESSDRSAGCRHVLQLSSVKSRVFSETRCETAPFPRQLDWSFQTQNDVSREMNLRDWGRDRCNQSAGSKSSERTRFYLSTAVSSSLQIRTIVVSKIRDLIQTVKFWWGWNQILRNEFFAKHDTALSPTSDSVVLCTVYVSM